MSERKKREEEKIKSKKGRSEAKIRGERSDYIALGHVKTLV